MRRTPSVASFLLPTLFLALLALPVLGAPPAGETRLLLDDRLIERVENARLTVGTVRKHPANPLFREDRPWEVRYDNLYPNVIYDPVQRLYRCWYSPFIIDESVSTTPREQYATVNYAPKMKREMGVCYATSRDGLVWEKPELGLVEFNGSKANNLVMRGPHGSGVFQDAHDADPARRFKMLFQGMNVAFSPDGVHWGEPLPCPEIVARGDTHNQALWVEEQHQYVGITRLSDGQRLVGRTTSPDFVHWTKAVEVMRGDKENQTYAMSVFRAGQVFLGLAMIYRKEPDRVHCELAWSPDTITWHRIEQGTPFIPLSEKPGDYDWGCVYAAVAPIVMKNGDVRIYHSASNGKHTNWRDGFFCLSMLRPDGWAGYKPAEPEKPGIVLTKAISATAGDLLRLTADAEGGSVVVTILDEAGREIGRSKPITANVTRAAVEWEGGNPFAALAGKAVRVRFELSRAAVYAFSIGG